MTTDAAVDYARNADFDGLPADVREQVRLRTLDALAATTAGYRFPATDVTLDYARSEHDGAAATVLDGSGVRVSVAGAALANGAAANALDVDDGHREVKGHPAAVVVPPALAAAEAADATVGEFLSAVTAGYEVGVRAGLAIHATDGVYTGTGSWGAVGAAAAVARLRGLDADRTAHALGAAEYHAPRTPIMRGVERPGMTKDGVAWGAYAGAAAASLAERGFTASGTVFDESAVDVTHSLGERFCVTEGYVKPYPCCRWAHPGVEAVLDLRANRDVEPSAVERVVVHTFEEATHLGTRRPTTADHAQYSYPYPVAAALARGRFTTAELRERARTNEAVLALAERVELRTDADIDDRFPAECLGRVTVETADGTAASSVVRPRGARERPLSADAVREKACDLLAPTLDDDAAADLVDVLHSPERPVTTLVSGWRA